MARLGRRAARSHPPVVVLRLELQEIIRDCGRRVVRFVASQFEREERVCGRRGPPAGPLPRQEILLVGREEIGDVLCLSFKEALGNLKAAIVRGRQRDGRKRLIVAREATLLVGVAGRARDQLRDRSLHGLAHRVGLCRRKGNGEPEQGERDEHGIAPARNEPLTSIYVRKRESGHAVIHMITRRADESSHFPTCFFAAAMTASVVKPKCFITSFTGADAPNERMPMTAPVAPAYFSQPERRAGLDADACRHARRQHRIAVRLRLFFEQLPARQAHHACLDSTRRRASQPPQRTVEPRCRCR